MMLEAENEAAKTLAVREVSALWGWAGGLGVRGESRDRKEGGRIDGPSKSDGGRQRSQV